MWKVPRRAQPWRPCGRSQTPHSSQCGAHEFTCMECPRGGPEPQERHSNPRISARLRGPQIGSKPPTLAVPLSVAALQTVVQMALLSTKKGCRAALTLSASIPNGVHKASAGLPTTLYLPQVGHGTSDNCQQAETGVRHTLKTYRFFLQHFLTTVEVLHKMSSIE